MGTVIKKIPSYLSIANQIEADIIQGKIAVGHKLGSIRLLAKSEGVSINTVRAALDTLTDKGLINSVARIGFVVSYQQETKDAAPFERFTPDSRLAPSSQRWLNTMVRGNRTNHPFFHMAVPTTSKMFKSFIRQYHQVILQNLQRDADSAAGISSLRKNISQHLAQRQCYINSRDIQITNGCQNALEHALRVLCKPGDTVAVPVPAFPGYFALLSMLGLKALEIPMSPLGPDPALLEEAMKETDVKAVIIQPNCHNPTGITLSDAYKKNIAAWAKAYQVPVIEDDISAQLNFIGPTAKLISSFDNDGWCLIISSISKVIGDTERIGWCCPGRFSNQFMTQFAVSQISNSYYLQQALTRYYQGSLYHSQLRNWRRDINVATSAVSQKLAQALGNKIQITPSSGGYALWIKLPEKINAAQLHANIDIKQIDFLSGELFSLQGHFKQYIRLIVMPPLSEDTLSGIEHLITTINALDV